MDNSEIGNNWTKITSNPLGNIVKGVYKDHNQIIAGAIRSHFNNKQIVAADFGGGSGSLIKDLKRLINEKELNFTNIDKDKSLLDEDSVSIKKIVAHLENVQLKDRFDLIIMRYVLHYNSFNIQDKIIHKARSLLKKEGLFILHHCGSVDHTHKQKLNKLFSTPVISEKLVRKNPYWSTWSEISTLLKNNKFKIKVLEQYKIPIGDLYKQRYDLTDEEDKKLHDYLGSYDFIDYVISGNTLQ
ncbi:MAG: Methyltransferase domain [archaeon]|jgi:SAM-dependent methyltransferase